MEEIKVQVVTFKGRTNLMLRYVDPMTGKQVHKSSGCTKRKEAERAAAKWEAELREGRYFAGSKMLWSDFRTRYEDEVLAGRAKATDHKVSGVFNSVERILSPKRLCDLTAQRLSYFQSKLREAGRAESTIKSCLAHLRSALNWAVGQSILATAPKIEKPKRAKGGKLMKGRPITGEEFDRMLAAVPKVVGAERAPSWEHYLRGLWLSGLRLAESLESDLGPRRQAVRRFERQAADVENPRGSGKGQSGPAVADGSRVCRIPAGDTRCPADGLRLRSQGRPRTRRAARRLHCLQDRLRDRQESGREGGHEDEKRAAEDQVRFRSGPAAIVRRAMVNPDHAASAQGTHAARVD